MCVWGGGGKSERKKMQYDHLIKYKKNHISFPIFILSRVIYIDILTSLC